MKAHGGDIYTRYNLKYSERLVDFSANINPFGMPETAKKAIVENIDGFISYPDTECRELRNAIAAAEGVKAEWIWCGNGAADLIFRSVYALHPKKALIPAPTFSEYETALKTAGCETEIFQLEAENGFELTPAFTAAVKPDTDMIFVCNPNNPTGKTTEREPLLALLEKAKAAGAVLAVDECFLDFTGRCGELSLKKYLAEYDNLIIFKAFTKIYGMAGVRLGYMLCSNAELTEKIKKCSQPWNVSTVASKCGVGALKAEGWIEKTVGYISREREFLLAGLRRAGMKPVESKANFILFYSDDEGLYDKLVPYGILLRRCSNFHGLDAHWYRIAVKSHKDNEWLIASLEKITR